MITIYYPEGSGAYTKHVDEHEIQSHMAGLSEWAHEAEALYEFVRAEEIPQTLLNGDYVLHGEGMADGSTPFAIYRRAYAE